MDLTDEIAEALGLFDDPDSAIPSSMEYRQHGKKTSSHLCPQQSDPGSEAGLMAESMWDTVIIGAGPVGLFLALLLKSHCPGMKVVMLEKYAAYQRKHVLNIEAASFKAAILDLPSLREPLSDLVGKVPTSHIEATLKKLVTSAGVEIRTGKHVENLDKLEADFKGAKYLIGADGRRSVIRAKRFGDALCQDYTVMRIVFCKYEVSGETQALGWLDYLNLSQGEAKVKHTVKELVGRPRDGKTAVTLQVFVDDKEFRALDGVTAKSPASVDDLLRKSPALGETLQAWIQRRVATFRERLEDIPRINPVPLDVYQAATVVKRGAELGDPRTDIGAKQTKHNHARRRQVWALVGDAAFGVPFFRALNDGLLCATSLANAIAKDWKMGGWRTTEPPPGDGSAFFKPDVPDPIETYAAYFKSLAARERRSIGVKGSLIGAGVSAKNAKRSVISAKRDFLSSVASHINPFSQHASASGARADAAQESEEDPGLEEEEEEEEEAHDVPTGMAVERVPAVRFYSTYYGHKLRYLDVLHTQLRAHGKRNILWLAGDSTLDNKHWIGEMKPAINAYEEVFDEPWSKADVAYWMNDELINAGAKDWACINCAREEHTLSVGLNEQDCFIQEHLQENDVLVCCIGGNDIALRPSATTIAKMIWLTQFARHQNISEGTAGGLGHFWEMFGQRTQRYIEQLVSRRRPRCVVVCMLYYLDENPEQDAWANSVLKVLGYDSQPEVLQSLIQSCFINGTCQVRIEGTRVIPVPLFQSMDGKDSRDYAERVEPSERGGRKMAQAAVRAAASRGVLS